MNKTKTMKLKSSQPVRKAKALHARMPYRNSKLALALSSGSEKQKNLGRTVSVVPDFRLPEPEKPFVR
jgi:hypothetical protein